MLEIGNRIAAADDDADALSELWRIGTGEQCRKGGCTARLRDNPQYLPESLLSLDDRVVLDEHDAMHMVSRDRKNALTDSARRKGICRQTSGFCIDRMSSLQCPRQRWASERLDTDDLDAARVPRGDSCNETATADGHEQRVKVRGLFIKLRADRALSKDGLILVVCVNRGGPFAIGESR